MKTRLLAALGSGVAALAAAGPTLLVAVILISALAGAVLAGLCWVIADPDRSARLTLLIKSSRSPLNEPPTAPTPLSPPVRTDRRRRPQERR
jgi:hypothetical protein